MFNKFIYTYPVVDIRPGSSKNCYISLSGYCCVVFWFNRPYTIHSINSYQLDGKFESFTILHYLVYANSLIQPYRIVKSLTSDNVATWMLEMVVAVVAVLG